MEAYNTIVHTLNNKCEDSKSLTSRRFIHWMSWIFKRRKVKSSIGSCWKQEKYIIDTCTKKYDLVRTTSVLRKTCSVDHYSRREWGQWTFPWFFFLGTLIKIWIVLLTNNLETNEDCGDFLDFFIGTLIKIWIVSHHSIPTKYALQPVETVVLETLLVLRAGESF